METPPQSPRVLTCPGGPMKQNNMYTTPPQSPREVECPSAPMKEQYNQCEVCNKKYENFYEHCEVCHNTWDGCSQCPCYGISNTDMYECDDCNKKGINCLENLGLSQHEINVYWDAGEPDRCDECFEKWRSSEDEDIQEIVRMMDA